MKRERIRLPLVAHRKAGGKVLFFSWENLGAFLGFAILACLFHEKAVFEGYSFIFMDSSRFFYPMWKWGAHVFQQGLIPLWNPDAQFGVPYLMDFQNDCAYPPLALLYHFLGYTAAFNWNVVLHHAWALFGFWVFARGQGFSRWVALFGSLAFGFSLHVVCSSWTPVALMAISWIPWVFWGAEGVFQNWKGAFFPLSLVWAFQLAAGYPVISYLTGIALFFDLAWRSVLDKGGDWREKYGWALSLVFSILPAVAYNLVWGLPFVEFYKLSNFGKGAERYSALGLEDLATWLSPFYREHPFLPNYHGPHYWIGTYFVGLPTVTLLLWGFWKRKYPRNLVGGWILFFILCMGETAGLGGWLKKIIPFYSLVIHSGFWLSILVFWTARMAMNAAKSLWTESKSWTACGKWLVLSAGVYGASCLLSPPFFPMAFFTSFLLLGAALLPWIAWPSLRWGLLTVALALSLAPEARSINIMLESSYYDSPPGILSGLTKPGRFFFSPSLMKQAQYLQGKDMTDAYERAKQRLYPDWPLTYFREEVQMYNAFFLFLPEEWSSKCWTYSRAHFRKVLDFLSIRYLVGKSHFEELVRVSTPDAEEPVAENPTLYPKWFSVQRARPSSTLEDDFGAADHDRMSYGHECFVPNPGIVGNYASRKVAEIFRTPNRVELSAGGKGRALLVSSETDYPGWRIKAEGKPKPVEQVNHVFRGVVLEDGETHVVCSYEPSTFRLGLFSALLTCGFWMGLLLRARILK